MKLSRYVDLHSGVVVMRTTFILFSQCVFSKCILDLKLCPQPIIHVAAIQSDCRTGLMS